MPMGAKASTAALYQAMVNSLGDALYRYALVWADDIMIYSKTPTDHVTHVDNILKRLDQNGFCIARDKMELGKTKVKWLGYEISDKGIQPDQEKVNKLLTMRKPENKKELKSILGMWTYFSSFIPRYSIIAAPLTSQLKTKGDEKYDWTEECEKAWNEMKHTLASAPIMGYPDYSLPLYLHTDACRTGFAAILTQDQSQGRVIVDATSRTTTDAEKKYCSSKLECACVIWIARKWKHHLYSAPHTTIITDNYGLQFLQAKSTESTLVQRWICEMEGFRYSVRYRRGTLNIADFLSRQNDVPETVAPVWLRKQKPKDYKAMNAGKRAIGQDKGKKVEVDQQELRDCVSPEAVPQGTWARTPQQEGSHVRS